MELQIPNYTIEKELGRGGMATVYLARQVRLNRLVALKVMSAEFASGAAFQAAFLSEGQIIAQLEHPNIIKIYDISVFQDRIFFMAMEYLSGGSLRDRLKAGALTPETSLQVLKDIGAGLQYAHNQGFIHRDIKPENILFHKNGHAVLTDFGIAKLQDSTSDMTRMGLSAGTVQYMSPEQATTGKLDERSDLYSLGLVAFEMLSGEKVCQVNSLVRAIYHHTSLPPPDLPVNYQSFQAVFSKVLAKRPQDRYISIDNFVQAFEQALFKLKDSNSINLLESTDEKTILFIPTTLNDHSLLKSKKESGFFVENTIVDIPISSDSIKDNSKNNNLSLLFIIGLGSGVIIGLIIYLLLPFFIESRQSNATNLPKNPKADTQLVIPNMQVEPQSFSEKSSNNSRVTPSNSKITVSNQMNQTTIPADSSIGIFPPQIPTGAATKLRITSGLKGKEFLTTINLNLREKPNIDSAVQSALPAKTLVKVLDDQVYDQVIKGKTGSWLHVNALDKNGYVFNGYLESVIASNTLPAFPTTEDKNTAYVIRRPDAKLYKEMDFDSESQFLPLNVIVFKQSEEKKDSLFGENGQWLLVKTKQDKVGYIFDLDVFPLLRVDPQKEPALEVKFAKGTDTGVLKFNVAERRIVYVLIASKNQTMSIRPKNSELSSKARFYVFGDDLSIIANNKTSFSNRILPANQKYYINIHWVGDSINLANTILEFDLIIN